MLFFQLNYNLSYVPEALVVAGQTVRALLEIDRTFDDVGNRIGALVEIAKLAVVAESSIEPSPTCAVLVVINSSSIT